jgi:hypothetical protein
MKTRPPGRAHRDATPRKASGASVARLITWSNAPWFMPAAAKRSASIAWMVTLADHADSLTTASRKRHFFSERSRSTPASCGRQGTDPSKRQERLFDMAALDLRPDRDPRQAVGFVPGREQPKVRKDRLENLGHRGFTRVFEQLPDLGAQPLVGW